MVGSEGACSFLNCLLSCLQAEKEAVQREAMDLVVPLEQHFPNWENKRTVQEANVERYGESKNSHRSLGREGCRNVTVGQDGAGMVEPLGREAQSKTVWKTLPQGGQ